MSGLFPRLVGVGWKRIPKFGFLLGYSFIFEEDDPASLRPQPPPSSRPHSSIPFAWLRSSSARTSSKLALRNLSRRSSLRVPRRTLDHFSAAPSLSWDTRLQAQRWD